MARTLSIEPMAIEPLAGTSFGAVVTGVKVIALDDATWRELYAAWLKYALLIFPDQHLKRAEQIAFAQRFGPLEFEMAAISNVKSDGSLRIEADNDDVMKILKGNMGWHCDSTYMPVQAKGAVFSAEIVPSVGGHTGFADMRAAWMHSTRRSRPGSRSSRHITHCITASPRSATRPRSATANTAATACTTGRCRSGNW